MALAVFYLCSAKIAKYRQVSTASQLLAQCLGKFYSATQCYNIYVFRLAAEYDVAYITTYHETWALQFIGYLAYELKYWLFEVLVHSCYGMDKFIVFL
jgi:hypothetical protein